MRKTSLLLMLCLTVLFVCVAATTYKDTVISIDTTNGLWPNTDNTYDLGKTSYEFKDLYIDGTAYIDTLDVDAMTYSYTQVNSTKAVTPTVTLVNSGTVYTNLDLAAASWVVTLPTPASGAVFTFCDVQAGAGADLWISTPTGITFNGVAGPQWYGCVTDSHGQAATIMGTSAAAWVLLNTQGTWVAKSAVLNIDSRW